MARTDIASARLPSTAANPPSMAGPSGLMPSWRGGVHPSAAWLPLPFRLDAPVDRSLRPGPPIHDWRGLNFFSKVSINETPVLSRHDTGRISDLLPADGALQQDRSPYAAPSGFSVVKGRGLAQNP